MAKRDYVELAKQYALGKSIQRKRFSNTWYDLTQEDFDEHGNIVFNELDAYRVKPGIEFDTGLMNMTDNVLCALLKIGYSRADTCASIQNGIVRVKDGSGNVWRITITKEYSMVKYFCDICGRELRIADRVQIPTDLDFVKTQSLIQGLALGTAASLLCFECYSKLQDKYKDYLEKCKQSKKIV